MLTMRTGGAGLIIPGVEVIQAGGGEMPWWLAAGVTPVAAYAPKGAADLSSSYVNLANPGTFNASPGVAPTFNAATGWTFNGSTQYLTTGVIATRTYTAMVRFSGISNENYLFGSWKVTGTVLFGIGPNTSGSLIRYYNVSELTKAGLASGILAIAGGTAYKNGVAETGSMTANADTGLALYIGGFNRDGALNSPIAGNIQAIWIASSTLDATQILAMYTAMNAL